VTGGDGYVSLVEFRADGPVAWTSLATGNATRPGSPHITDQLPTYGAKGFGRAWTKRKDVDAHAVKIETY